MAYGDLLEKQKRLAELTGNKEWMELSAMGTAEQALTLLIAIAEVDYAENKKEQD